MMKKLCSLLALCSVAPLLLVACGSSGSDSNASANQVHMSNTNFVQSSITIKKGESVTLVADTLMAHPISFVTSGFVRDRRDLPWRRRLVVEPDVAVGGSKE